jgi:ABC-type branched-subunit amino acid transport system ATPase component
MRQYAVSILLVEQDSKLALDVADYAYVIEHGRVVAEGTSDVVKELPQLRAAYLGTAASVVSQPGNKLSETTEQS